MTMSCRDAAELQKPARHTTAPGAALWVDRYRPQRFTELLGDDRVHREVLSWVKEWDYCVFGRSKGRGRKRSREDADGENLDLWRRPVQKVSTFTEYTSREYRSKCLPALVTLGSAWAWKDYSRAYRCSARRILCLRDERKRRQVWEHH